MGQKGINPKKNTSRVQKDEMEDENQLYSPRKEKNYSRIVFGTNNQNPHHPHP